MIWSCLRTRQSREHNRLTSHPSVSFPIARVSTRLRPQMSAMKLSWAQYVGEVELKAGNLVLAPWSVIHGIQPLQGPIRH